MNRRKARVLALKILFQREYRDIPETSLRSLAALLDDHQDQKSDSDLSLQPRRPPARKERRDPLPARRDAARRTSARRGRPRAASASSACKASPKAGEKEEKRRKTAGLERIEFALKIVQGVERQREAIDQAIALAGESWTPDRMALIDLNIMRIAVFEMLFQPDIPGKTSVNEAVESAKIFGGKDSASFVNGVLDKVLQSPRYLQTFHSPSK